jgi:hypothetical protein
VDEQADAGGWPIPCLSAQPNVCRQSQHLRQRRPRIGPMADHGCRTFGSSVRAGIGPRFPDRTGFQSSNRMRRPPVVDRRSSRPARRRPTVRKRPLAPMECSSFARSGHLLIQDHITGGRVARWAHANSDNGSEAGTPGPGLSSRGGPRVRRLAAGGKEIRTLGPPPRETLSEQDW